MLRILTVASVAAVALACGPAEAKTLRWAFQGQLAALDPYTLNETFTLGQLGNVYEGLTRRGPDLKIEPALAERWETLEPTRWRFHLRRNVKFHNGNPFTADDVIFSAQRVRAQGSDLKTRIPLDSEWVKVDDHTVDVVLKQPNPILHFEWDTWYIIDKEWAEANDMVAPITASDASPKPAAYKTNGTGSFLIETHQPGVQTVFKANPNWWDKAEHNLTEVIFRPIAVDPTRVAALLSGEVDMIDPVPVQDVKRVNDSGAARVLSGPELRTIFLGFNSRREELKTSDVKGKNPFRDARVRRAFYQAIDIDAIKSRVMRDLSYPTSLLISPLLFERSGEFKRHAYSVEAAKALLTDAGYPNGFTVGMDCPNDRYVNDEAICQAATNMLARIGVKVNLNAQPKGKYFGKVLASGGYDTDFYLLGWTPGSFDSHNVLLNITGCRDETGKGGPFNFGGWCNDKIQELQGKIIVETDTAKRNDMIAEAFKIIHEEVSHIPLHQQSLAWGVSNKIEIIQRPDNQVLFRWVKVKG